MLKSTYKTIVVEPESCPRKHLDVMGTKYLESTEMWQPYENSEQSDKRYYEPQEILEMMHRL